MDSNSAAASQALRITKRLGAISGPHTDRPMKIIKMQGKLPALGKPELPVQSGRGGGEEEGAGSLTLNGSEAWEGGRVSCPDLEDVSPPVQARRGLHSDAVLKVWGWERKKHTFAITQTRPSGTGGPRRDLAGLTASPGPGLSVGQKFKDLNP